MIHDNWVSSCLWSRGVRSERRGRLIPPQSPDAGSGWWLCWGRWGGWNNEAGVSAKVEGARRTADDNRLQHWQMEWVTGWHEEVNDQACRRTRFLTVLFYESFITEVFSDVSVNLTSEKVPNKVSKSRTRTRVEAQIDIKTVSVITFFGKDPKKKWQIHLVFCFFLQWFVHSVNFSGDNARIRLVSLRKHSDSDTKETVGSHACWRKKKESVAHPLRKLF